MSSPLRAVDVNPTYADHPLPRTHAPPEVSGEKGFAKYRDCLRLEFSARCAYCLSHEGEVGPSQNYGGFEVEHFKPQGRREFHSLRNRYSNLLWACPTCNRAKGHRWPDPEEQKLGARFIDPTVEAMGDFLVINGVRVDQVEPTSQAAAYTIEQINLNSAAHKERRRKRQALAPKLALVEAKIEVLRERHAATGDADALDALNALESELREIGTLVGWQPTSWDMPSTCFCAAPAQQLRRRKPRTRRERRKQNALG